MKALILGQFVNLGGTQYLSYRIKEALQIMGYDIDIVCGKEHRFLPDAIDKVYKMKYPYYKEKSRVDILRNIKELKKELKFLQSKHYDLTFNNHPNTFLYKADINYLHGPSLIDSLILPNGAIKKNSLFYLLKYLKIYGIYNNANFLTHGKYTKRVSEANLPKIGIKPRRIDYIYIPVNLDFEINLEEKKKSTVLSFGRIMPDKNIEKILTVARNSNANFTIAGYLGPGQTNYLKKLEKDKPPNVNIVPNPDERTKKLLFSHSWSYIHPKPMEHFGISIAEAISYGCIPIVHRSGGGWEDIVDSGKFGLGYNSLEEASQKVNESFEMSIGERNQIYASRERFSVYRFNEKFLSLLKEYINK